MSDPNCGIVVFNYANWLAEYPEFGQVSPTQAQALFNRVTIGGPVDNTASSPMPYDPTATPPEIERLILLNAAVAHMAYLFGPQADGSAPRGAVGRISSATEGSVTGQFEYKIPVGDLEAWWIQSPYGAYYYAATLKYRTATYFPPPFRPILGGFRGLTRFGFRRF